MTKPQARLLRILRESEHELVILESEYARIKWPGDERKRSQCQIIRRFGDYPRVGRVSLGVVDSLVEAGELEEFQWGCYKLASAEQ